MRVEKACDSIIHVWCSRGQCPRCKNVLHKHRGKVHCRSRVPACVYKLLLRQQHSVTPGICSIVALHNSNVHCSHAHTCAMCILAALLTNCTLYIGLRRATKCLLQH